MSAAAEYIEDRDIALKLHGVLSDIDPARWRDEMAEALTSRLEEIQAWLERHERHAELASVLRSGLSTLKVTDLQLRERWLSLKQQLQPAYHSLAARLKAAQIHVPSLRPTNYARSLFHLSAGVVAAVVIELLRDPSILMVIALTWAGFAWTCEIARRFNPKVNAVLMRFFGPLAHAHEATRVNSATWYATALVALALTGSIPLCVVAVVVLGVADPTAGLIGRRFGRVRLVHGRSLEGTLAFLVSGTLAAGGVLTVFHPQLGLGGAWSIALGAALLGAAAELFSLRLDDNFTVPVSSAAGAAATAFLLGLPL